MHIYFRIRFPVSAASMLRRKRLYAGVLAIVLCIQSAAGNVRAVVPDSDTYPEKTELRQFQHNVLLHNALIAHDHPLVEKFRKQYMSANGYAYLSNIMKRSAPYRDFIIDFLEAEAVHAQA